MFGAAEPLHDLQEFSVLEVTAKAAKMNRVRCTATFLGGSWNSCKISLMSISLLAIADSMDISRFILNEAIAQVEAVPLTCTHGAVDFSIVCKIKVFHIGILWHSDKRRCLAIVKKKQQRAGSGDKTSSARDRDAVLRVLCDRAEEFVGHC